MKAALKNIFYFSCAVFALTAIVATIVNFSFELVFRDRIYPGVRVAGMDFGGQREADIIRRFNEKKVGVKIVTFSDEKTATFSAKVSDLGIRYDAVFMARWAMSIGRQTENFYYDFLQKLSAIAGQIDLPVQVSLGMGPVRDLENQIAQKVESEPIDAQFSFEPERGPDGRGRVVAFQASKNGQQLDRGIVEQKLKEIIINNIQSEELVYPIPIKTLAPKVTTSQMNRLGIKDLLGTGVSYFYDSIPGRIANIRVGTEKVSGSLVAPGEIFSFNNAIGTVSAVFGFQKAYVIKDNKTALEDGGGVCQVSTTLYRAALNAGLPITEREAHSYRVGYYEQGGFLPGMDATVYPPSPDFRFKNDTNAWILLQAYFDEKNYRLSFDIFGTTDGRTTNIVGPTILSVTPPPDPVYEDRPDLPIGTIQQTDTAHWGARTVFTRTVTRNGEKIIGESVVSGYVPWPARFLRGTKN